jgi:EmrB/QacA subfamily drug resistance transporter
VSNTRSQWWVVGLTSVASFMVILDMMVVATALTAIQRDLHASISDLEWTVNAYTLSFAALLMTGASLGDRFGRRRLFVGGLALFTVASAACALSRDVGVLIAARAVQGVGAAVIMPLALGLLNAAFPPERRGRAIGVYGSITALAVLLGPLVGGVITQGLAWQWIFWLNVPIGLLAIPFVLGRIKESHGPGAAVDVPGLALFTLAAFGLVWGLVRTTSAGWGSPPVVGALVAGVLLAVAFVAWEARAYAPMLPLRLFRSRAFSAGNAVIFLLNAGLTGSVFFMAQFIQVGMGQGPLGAGLRMLPWGVAPFLLAVRAGALADRLGERPLIVTGLALQALGVGWMALVASPHLSYALLTVPMSISGVGLALVIPAVTKAVVSAGAPVDIGKASGSYSTMRQLGGAFGVAILAAAFDTTGGYTSPARFSAGFERAMGAAAALTLAGLLVGLLVPKKQAVRPAPAPAPVEV